jgi:hypothetical protein
MRHFVWKNAKKKILALFATAFVLNAIWENLHSFLYAHYKGGAITEFILLRAVLADAVMIVIVAAPFLYISSLARRRWIAILILLLMAVAIELYALPAGRWAYNEHMPLIPFLGVGLTPTVQLALLGYFSLKLTNRFFKRSDTKS